MTTEEKIAHNKQVEQERAVYHKRRCEESEAYKRVYERMMNNAMETTIVNDWQYGKDPDHAIIPAIHQRIEGFNVGDKVKIIIVKEEQ